MALTRPKYSQIYDTDWKQSVEVASTGDVGNLTLGNTQPNSIDGVSLSIGNRVLVKDQTRGWENGIYSVRSVGTGSNGWWERSLDANQNSFVTSGLTASIVAGSLNGGKEFKLTTLDPITLGVTALTFINPFAASAGGANTQVQFNDNSVVSGSAGLTFNKTSNTVTVANSIISSSFYGNIAGGSILPNVYITGSLLPSANVTYDLGSPTQKFRSAYFSGNTVYIGSESVSVAGNGTWTFTSAGASVDLGANAVFNPPSANIAGNTSIGQNLTVNGNVTAGYYIGSGQFLSALPGYAYSNVNVAAYTQTQSFTNYSNVNLSAYLGGSVTIGGNLSVTGNLFVNGNVTTINANNLSINDSLIYLADDNPADLLDIGFVSAFTDAVRYQHTGFARDATDGIWKLFANVVPEPTTTIDFTNATYSNILVGNVLAQTVIASSFVGNGAALTGLPAGYSNVQVATYLPTYTGNITAGNIIVTASGQFSGVFNESTTTSGVFVGNAGSGTPTPRVGFFNGTAAQNWQIDNSMGLFRWYTPGVTQMTLNSSGVLSTTTVNASGNVLSTGAIHNSLTVNGVGTITGNTSHGTVGAVSGQWHTFVGNITQTTSGGIVYINTTGNISAAQANFGNASIAGGSHTGINAIAPAGNAVVTLGSLTNQWSTIYGKATTAQYADLAEIYTTDQQYPAGTVVVFGGSAEVMQSHSSHDTRIAGVVSTNPAYLMNSTETGVPVALQGRVPCRVLGPVEQGDRVVSSHIPGVAQRLDPQQYEPGCIIGKALQAIDSTDISIIEVVVGRV